MFIDMEPMQIKDANLQRATRRTILRQINTFFVDFDTLDPNFDYGEILLASHELGFMPTMVLRTPTDTRHFMY